MQSQRHSVELKVEKPEVRESGRERGGFFFLGLSPVHRPGGFESEDEFSLFGSRDCLQGRRVRSCSCWGGRGRTGLIFKTKQPGGGEGGPSESNSSMIHGRGFERPEVTYSRACSQRG